MGLYVLRLKVTEKKKSNSNILTFFNIENDAAMSSPFRYPD
jgi:hypothetical protein